MKLIGVLGALVALTEGSITERQATFMAWDSFMDIEQVREQSRESSAKPLPVRMSKPMQLITVLNAIIAVSEGRMTEQQATTIAQKCGLKMRDVRKLAIESTDKFFKECNTPGTPRNQKWSTYP